MVHFNIRGPLFVPGSPLPGPVPISAPRWRASPRASAWPRRSCRAPP